MPAFPNLPFGWGKGWEFLFVELGPLGSKRWVRVPGSLLLLLRLLTLLLLLLRLLTLLLLLLLLWLLTLLVAIEAATWFCWMPWVSSKALSVVNSWLVAAGASSTATRRALVAAWSALALLITASMACCTKSWICDSW
jgi:hypothetical protein